MKKLKIALVAFAVIGILSAFATKGPRLTSRLEVKQTISGKWEVKLVDISTLTKGTASGQYNCNLSVPEVCVIYVNTLVPDGYLDAPLNQRPYYNVSTQQNPNPKFQSKEDGDFFINP